MENIILINKPVGLTPLEAIQKYKKTHPKMADVPMTYAGRLDPMAEGLLLVLSGNAIKKKKEYMNLDKEYVAEFLFGISSDTYDALGIVRERNKPTPKQEDIKNEIQKLEGMHAIPLPPYSSYRMKGHPLFWWARKKKLKKIVIPKKEMTVYSAKLLSMRSAEGVDVRKKAIKKIGLVSGDFRQESIEKSWKKTKEKKYIIAKVKIKCSSGTYIRSLAHLLGKTTGTGAILFSLKRTKIGKYSI